MKKIKTYELFYKNNNKGNYLTKKDQPEDNFNQYLYNNGFGDRYYICSNCGSYRMTPILIGGFQPPRWICDDCDSETGAPSWMSPDEYELRRDIKKYNL